jgi:hypothetical protein
LELLWSGGLYLRIEAPLYLFCFRIGFFKKPHTLFRPMLLQLIFAAKAWGLRLRTFKIVTKLGE